MDAFLVLIGFLLFFTIILNVIIIMILIYNNIKRNEKKYNAIIKEKDEVGFGRNKTLSKDTIKVEQ